MPLPSTVRAYVGILATACDAVRRLPTRIVEMPMLVVSSTLQASLRVQQRYAGLVARGDEVLQRDDPSDEAPEWATFDEPVDDSALRTAADNAGAAQTPAPKVRSKVNAPRHAPPSAFDDAGEGD